MSGFFCSTSIPLAPGFRVDHVNIVLLQNAGQSENIAQIVVDDQHLPARPASDPPGGHCARSPLLWPRSGSSSADAAAAPSRPANAPATARSARADLAIAGAVRPPAADPAGAGPSTMIGGTKGRSWPGPASMNSIPATSDTAQSRTMPSSLFRLRWPNLQGFVSAKPRRRTPDPAQPGNAMISLRIGSEPAHHQKPLRPGLAWNAATAGSSSIERPFVGRLLHARRGAEREPVCRDARPRRRSCDRNMARHRIVLQMIQHRPSAHVRQPDVERDAPGRFEALGQRNRACCRAAPPTPSARDLRALVHQYRGKRRIVLDDEQHRSPD